MNPWEAPYVDGLVLRAWMPPAQSPRAPLVACVILKLDDVGILLERCRTWASAVDRVVIVLGAWTSREPAAAIKQATEMLGSTFRSLGKPCDVVTSPKPWKDQVEKRSAYFKMLRPGEIGFVIDADEQILEGPDALRAAAALPFDVGWITVSAPHRYQRPYGQPRLFRVPAYGLEYRERHYWVYSRGDGRLMAAHSYGGIGWHHERLPLTLENRGGERTPAHDVQAEREGKHGSHPTIDHTKGLKIEPLRIAQVMGYDAGLVAYRLHSAINSTTRERSLMVSSQTVNDNPYRAPWQYDLNVGEEARRIVNGADIVHCHVSYQAATMTGGIRRDHALVIHHHGTVYRTDPERWDVEDQRAILRLASTMNLMLLDKTKTMQWLPNPVPVALYRAMARAELAKRAEDGEFWIAHSPSKPHLKGTEDLQKAVRRLQAKKLPIKLVLTHNVPHREALLRKAACDICFDSFWLGIQVSGLEAAAMGMPVIAGDQETADAYKERLGEVPYSLATDGKQLEQVLERLVVDSEYRESEAQRVSSYVLTLHDEAAVALRYLELLRAAIGSDHRLSEQLAEAVSADRRERAQLLRNKIEEDEHPTNFRLAPRLRGK